MFSFHNSHPVDVIGPVLVTLNASLDVQAAGLEERHESFTSHKFGLRKTNLVASSLRGLDNRTIWPLNDIIFPGSDLKINITDRQLEGKRKTCKKRH